MTEPVYRLGIEVTDDAMSTIAFEDNTVIHMNTTFAQYATSAAFAIQLSKNQCNILLRIDASAIDFSKSADERTLENSFWHLDDAMAPLAVGPMQSLEARGLIFWHRRPDGKANGFGGLTAAGKLTVGLLKEAGLTIENTNTVSVLKRLQAA